MKLKILIIEDNSKQSEPFVKMLKYRGYEVSHAYNGIDGIANAVENHPHLIIVDLLLVERGDQLDGYEVIQALRNKKETAHIGILAWTGHYVDAKDEILAFRLGADDFVRKDIDVGRLEARIEALLRRVKNR